MWLFVFSVSHGSTLAIPPSRAVVPVDRQGGADGVLAIVAVRALQPGRVLSGSDLRVVCWPAESLPAEVIEGHPCVGRRLVERILDGELIRPSGSRPATGAWGGRRRCPTGTGPCGSRSWAFLLGSNPRWGST